MFVLKYSKVKIMNKYFEINKSGHNIRCKIYANDLSKVEKVILFCHGFAGHKDNGTAEKFADRVLSKNKGVAVLIFNWPSHGDDVKRKISLNDCMEYLGIVLQYVRETFNTEDIYSCATSFGGYLVLRYIPLYGNPFKKIALRCPAVNMYDVLTGTIMNSDEYSRIRKGKSVAVGFDRKIEVDAEFLKNLKDSDIQKVSYLDYSDDILIVHGTADEVVPFEAAKRFAENNVIKFVTVEGADHRFQHPSTLEYSTKAIIRFFGLA